MLSGRAMIHLRYRSSNARSNSAKDASRRAETSDQRVSINACHGVDQRIGFSNLGNPLCCSAFRRGWVVSAHLLRSPASSDCAFIQRGCSVSSRYTFPKRGLGSALSAICHFTTNFYKAQADCSTAPHQGTCGIRRRKGVGWWTKENVLSTLKSGKVRTA